MPGLFRCLTLIAILFTPATAASQDAAANEFFEKRIRPVLEEHCIKCHGADEAKSKGKLNLSSRSAMLAGGESGPAIIPGDPSRSLLLTAVKHDSDLKMPPKGKLSDQQIADLAKWVKDGAPWPDTGNANRINRDTAKPLFTDEERKFWAFQPVREPSIPGLSERENASTDPIDRFIQARLTTAGLKPSAPADRRTLLRRVAFDLTGLPPTPEQIDAFVNDSSPNAWEKVIDQLLASSAYGERWARHWLDVVRYADSNGLDENTSFGNAWRYRDYVIRSFNADKPFHRFIQEQLAGDLLPDGGSDGLIATGFLVLGPKVLAEPDKQKMMMDIVDEQIDVVSKAFLGLTIACARCHDHKFDPLPTRDYYALAGIFKSTKTMATFATVAKAHERPVGAPESDESRAFRAEIAQLQKELKAIEQQFSATPADDKQKRQELHQQAELRRAEIKRFEVEVVPIEMALAVQDESNPADAKIHIRGSHLTLGEVAPRAFPQILAWEKQNAVPVGASGRLQLANWIASPANPLTARVIVNRIWQHHFGEGLVRSPDNFGKLGERPTHPELLDWLAVRFIQDGWSFKKLHRRILLSKTYQQSTMADPIVATVDPDNRLLSHFAIRRLEAETIRDAMLQVAGTLDHTPGGSLLNNGNFEYINNEHSRGEVRYGTTRRSVYLPVIRNNVYDFFQVFDFVEPHVTNGKRTNTVVASQALFMMNNPLVLAQAKAFAQSLLKLSVNDEDRVQAAYIRAYGRPANSEEVSRTIRFLKQYQTALESKQELPNVRRQLAWQAWCHALFASSEFVTVN